MVHVCLLRGCDGEGNAGVGAMEGMVVMSGV